MDFDETCFVTQRTPSHLWSTGHTEPVTPSSGNRPRRSGTEQSWLGLPDESESEQACSEPSRVRRSTWSFLEPPAFARNILVVDSRSRVSPAVIAKAPK